jgi:hypothetical protein
MPHLSEPSFSMRLLTVGVIGIFVPAICLLVPFERWHKSLFDGPSVGTGLGLTIATFLLWTCPLWLTYGMWFGMARVVPEGVLRLPDMQRLPLAVRLSLLLGTVIAGLACLAFVSGVSIASSKLGLLHVALGLVPLAAASAVAIIADWGQYGGS